MKTKKLFLRTKFLSIALFVSAQIINVRAHFSAIQEGINGAHLPLGLYYGEIQIGTQTQSIKLIKLN